MFRTLLSSGVFACFFCTALGAQPPPDARVAILSTLNNRWTYGATSFVAELQRLGYVEGRNLTLDYLLAEDKPARLAELAGQLVGRKPDVILGMGTVDSSLAAMKATATIPIVFVHSADAVRAGLVVSLGRPGGNVTGVTSLNADLNAKRLELIIEIVPRVRRVAVLVSPVDPSTPSMVEALKAFALLRGVDLDFVEVLDSTRLSRVVSDAAKAGASAILVLGSPPLARHMPSLAQLALEHRLPAVTPWREPTEKGLLVGYGNPSSEMFQQAAGMVDRILRGAKPADMPVEQPTKFELIINLNTAKAIGLTIPEPVLERANYFIR
jgi:putative ABC transport system substrate-binding protein